MNNTNDLIKNIILNKPLENIQEGVISSIAKGVGRAASKLVPGVNDVVGVADTTTRAASGDTTGAAISAFGTAASNVPVVGTVAGIAADVVNTVRDVTGMSNNSDSDSENKPANTPTPDNSSDNSNKPSTPSSINVSKSITKPIKNKRPMREETDIKFSKIDNDSKILKNQEIKKKIIDENEKRSKTVKDVVKTKKTQIEFEPELNKPDNSPQI